jgi:hypothetical protein
MDDPKKVTETISERVTQTVTEPVDMPSNKTEESEKEAARDMDPAFYHEIGKNPADDLAAVGTADDEAPAMAWEEEEDVT